MKSVLAIVRCLEEVSPQDRENGRQLVKSRLTAVISIFADDTNGNYIVVGPSKKSVIFPKRFDTRRDLVVFLFFPEKLGT